MALITVLSVVYLQIFKTLEWKKLLEIKIMFCIPMKKKLACPPKLVSSSSSSSSSSSIYIYIYYYYYYYYYYYLQALVDMLTFSSLVYKT